VKHVARSAQAQAQVTARRNPERVSARAPGHAATRLPGRFFLVAFLVTASYGASPSVIIPDSIRPGMKGYGLSVFSGYEIERFEVEVIDVMRNVSPRRDLILARLSGAGLEHSGVIAGMSGSPVFLDGRLAGAVAYAWGFSKEPIAGITPIGEMLEVWDLPTGSGQGSGSRRPGTGGYGEAGMGEAPGFPLTRSQPLIPVALSGYSPRLDELVRPDLAELGLFPVAAAGSASDLTPAEIDSMLVPGAAVGVALVDGDVSLSGIGTLTWREKDRFVAFGHPMFQAGAVALPMTGGRIHTIVASLVASFKLFSPSRPVGTVDQDRLPAIGGRIGPVPKMIPVRIVLASPYVSPGSAPTKRHTYNYRVVRAPELAGRMAAIGLAEVLFSTEGGQEEMTLESEMKVTVEDSATITVRHFYSGPGTAEDIYRRAAIELEALFSNPFRPVDVTAIGFDVRLTPGLRRVRLVSCRPEKPVARRGERVTLLVTMKDERDRTIVERREFTLPMSTPEGKMQLVVTSRDTLRVREQSRGLVSSEPHSLSGLYRMLEASGGENVLVVCGYLPVQGLTVGQTELPAPPVTLRKVIEGASAAGPVRRTPESRFFVESFVLDRAIQGACELTLEVR